MKRSDISTFDVLMAAKLAHTEKKAMTWYYIYEKTGAPEKVVYAAMEREYDRGYLECGVSVRTSWLTEKGKKKLEELQIEIKNEQNNSK